MKSNIIYLCNMKYTSCKIICYELKKKNLLLNIEIAIYMYEIFQIKLLFCYEKFNLENNIILFSIIHIFR